MVNREKLDEREWKIRYIAEQRFPGFTAEVRKLWETLDKPGPNRRSPEEIALALSSKLCVNTEDKLADVSTESEDSGGSDCSQVEEWMTNILDYESGLDDLDDDALSDTFKAAIVDARPPMQDEIEAKRKVETSGGGGRDSMLRYAYWEEDDLIDFLSYGRPRSELASLKDQVKEALMVEISPFPGAPDLVLDWARGNGISNTPKLLDLQKINPEFIWHASSKRMQSIWIIIAAMAEKQYGTGKDFGTLVSLIASNIEDSGRSLKKETVRKILSQAREQSPKNPPSLRS